MIYMSRLGIWGEDTPFRTLRNFCMPSKRCALHAHVMEVGLQRPCFSYVVHPSHPLSCGNQGGVLE